MSVYGVLANNYLVSIQTLVHYIVHTHFSTTFLHLELKGMNVTALCYYQPNIYKLATYRK